MLLNLNPEPNVTYFRAPLKSLSLKYPALKAKEFSYIYSTPKAHVYSLNSSLKPSGASPNDEKIPLKKLTSSCIYGGSPSPFKETLGVE